MQMLGECYANIGHIMGKYWAHIDKIVQILCKYYANIRIILGK